MTPKEKAEELFDKFRLNVVDYEGSGLNNYKGKQCALIAVDEVIESLHEHHWQNRLIINYWEEVKHELNKQQEQ